MANFCRDCGSPLKEGAKFCAVCGRAITQGKLCSCGAPIKEGAKFCAVCGRALVQSKFCSCGAPMKKGAKFCAVCGKPLTEAAILQGLPIVETIPKAPITKKNTVGTHERASGMDGALTAGQTLPIKESKEIKAMSNAAKAAATSAAAKVTTGIADGLAQPAPGEEIIGFFGTPGNAAASVFSGTGRVLTGSFRQFFHSLKALFKNPQKLIIPLVLAGLWIVLDILQVRNIDILPTRILSFLTFAKGGMSKRVFGFIGGIIGKGIFAGALTSLAALLTRKKSERKRSFSDAFKGSFGVSIGSLGGYLVGIGTAMLCYLFISGNLIKSGFMAGIAAAYLSAKATLNRGFLQNLIGSISAKGKTSLGLGAAGIMKGLTIGFMAAAVIGQIQNRLIIIIPGIVLMLVGLVVLILQTAGVIKLGRKGTDAV